jgi:hypothetical protein
MHFPQGFCVLDPLDLITRVRAHIVLLRTALRTIRPFPARPRHLCVIGDQPLDRRMICGFFARTVLRFLMKGAPLAASA